MVLACVILSFLTLIFAAMSAVLLWRRREEGPGEEVLALLEGLRSQFQLLSERCTEGFQQERRELNEGFSANRVENSKYFNAQSEQMRSAFEGFVKTLLEFQNAVRKAEADSGKKLGDSLQDYGDRSARKFSELAQTLEEKINLFRTEFQQQFERNRESVDQRLKSIQEESARKLEEMKKTVDEKLQESVDKHFNESFKLISERLEQVHKGLGEMQTLASGVGDLKKVLTNVKTRGNIGEIQLSAILEQYLAPDQYAANLSTVPNSNELVEFAIKMPGKYGEAPVYLPIDSKFPVEDYQRLLDVYEAFPRMSPEVRKAQESFARTVRHCAAAIHDKYIYPPNTTAFGMMFVPSEGIYAEILRVPGLFEQLQNQHQIAVVGPSNLVAFLNSLQLGFKTLAIEKRSHEVWTILGAVKTEFRKFGEEMDSTSKSLQAVVKHMDKIGTRSRVLERRLRSVQELPASEAARVLENAPVTESEPAESTTEPAEPAESAVPGEAQEERL